MRVCGWYGPRAASELAEDDRYVRDVEVVYVRDDHDPWPIAARSDAELEGGIYDHERAAYRDLDT